jgi:CubicO group peptidase (beta-lactamase class C family)
MKKMLLLATALCYYSGIRANRSDSTITFRQLTDSIQSIMRQDNMVGLMLGITTKDSVLYAGGFGYADLSSQRKVDAQTLFRMGSITKMLVSLGIMQLVAEGKLTLQTPLKALAPEVPFHNPWEATHPLLIVHLLEHTSGFDDIKLNSMYVMGPREDRGANVMLVHKNSMTCRWQPGERMAYCNPNYSILGYLIEKLSGKPYHQYLTEKVLAPLGMTNSNFNTYSRLPQDVREYSFERGRIRPVSGVTLLSGAAGSLWSSPADMVKLLQLYLRNGAPLVTAAVLADMEKPHSSLAARAGLPTGYALGIQDALYYAQYPFRGHSGLVGTCFSSFYYCRERSIGFVVACNSNTSQARIETLLVAYLEQLVPAKPLSVQPTDTKALAPYLGTYQFESPRNVIASFIDKLSNMPQIYLQGGELFFKPLVGKAHKLVQTGPLLFAFEGDGRPRLALTANERGHRVLMMGGTYYEQVNRAGALAKRILLALAALLALLAALASGVAVAKRLLGRITTRQLLPRLLPLAGTAGLAWASLNLLDVQSNTYKLSELADVNLRTGVICVGTALYGITAAATLSWALIRFIKTKKGWVWLTGALGMCCLAFLLWQNGWLGLRTWAM